MQINRQARALFLTIILLSLLLAACSGQPANQITEPGELVSTTEAFAPPPPVTTLPAADTAEVAVLSPTISPEAAPTESAPLFDSIPTGVTDNGFPYLGSAEAPVTLIDYSDFL